MQTLYIAVPQGHPGDSSSSQKQQDIAFSQSDLENLLIVYKWIYTSSQWRASWLHEHFRLELVLIRFLLLLYKTVNWKSNHLNHKPQLTSEGVVFVLGLFGYICVPLTLSIDYTFSTAFVNNMAESTAVPAFTNERIL